MRRLTLLLLIFSIPAVGHAAVEISEVAWMGSSDSANHEWIELHNTGSESVSLEGWTLRAADGTPSIALSGAISAGSWFLLERTSDESAPGVTADQIYTGALGNEGEILELVNETGSVIDRVEGSDGWAIGGDNISKDTLQRIGGAWATGAPTPRAGNAAEVSPSSEQSQGEASSGSAPRTTAILTGREKDSAAPRSAKESRSGGTPLFWIDAGADRSVTVGVETKFSAHIYEDDGDERLGGTITWNFGDGTLAEGRDVSHVYLFPGQYMVQARMEATQFREPIVAESEFIVTAVAADVAVTFADPFSIELANQSDYKVSLSGWALATAAGRFTIPEGTVILPNARVRIPVAASKLVPGSARDVSLYYPSGALARAAQGAPSISLAGSGTPAPHISSNASPEARVVPRAQSGSYDIAEAAPVPASAGNIAAAHAAAGIPEAQSETNSSQGRFSWIIALMALVALASAAALFIAREEQEVEEYLADKFDIIVQQSPHESDTPTDRPPF